MDSKALDFRGQLYGIVSLISFDQNLAIIMLGNLLKSGLHLTTAIVLFRGSVRVLVGGGFKQGERYGHLYPDLF